MKIETALISVSDKTGLIEFAKRLREMGIQILSTGGTGKALAEADITYTAVSEHTGFPEILDGRVKTLHPRIHAGILASHDTAEHSETLAKHKIEAIGLVVVNLYPFAQAAADAEASFDDVIEQIDIGGPALIRAAAKNLAHATIVVDPADYPAVIAELRVNSCQTSRETRWNLARKAFHHTAAYDGAISGYFENQSPKSGGDDSLPAALSLSLSRHAELRYGENPHQRAALYRPSYGETTGLAAARLHQGKQLSFNNYVDLGAAWQLVEEFDDTACAIIKHTNPCGVALAGTAKAAYEAALRCDPLSAFGSIIAFNRAVDEATAEAMAELFVEAVVAPDYEAGALNRLSKKKNLRVMELPAKVAGESDRLAFDLKMVPGGILVQDPDHYFVKRDELKTVTQRPPGEDELRDLLFAWRVSKHVKSNAIVLAKDGVAVGVGAGQMSRVDSVKIAVMKARSPLDGAVMASDAFFPFPDSIQEAAKSGIRAVIQPGGSIRDEAVIQAADELDIAMVFTGIRHFRH